MSDDEWKDWCDFCIENGHEIDERERTEIYTIRVYAIYKTPKDQMDIIQENHDLFKKYVGSHTDYDENGNRGIGARIPLRPDHPEDIGHLRPYSEHDKFYKADKRKEKIDLENWEILDRFTYPF